jgi:hypothetical protein
MWSETKAWFHFMMLISVPLQAPYIAYCLSDAFRQDSPTYWRCCAWSRIGRNSQIICLSMVTVMWSFFLSYADDLGPLASSVANSRHTFLVRWLTVFCVVDLACTLSVNLRIITSSEPGRNSELDYWSYVSRLIFDLSQTLQIILVLHQGCRLKRRILGSGAFDVDTKLRMWRNIGVFMLIVSFCMLLEIASRTIGLLPLIYPHDSWCGSAPLDTSGNDDKAANWVHVMYDWQSKNTFLCQLIFFVLPLDGLSFALLYAMRGSARERLSSFVTNVSDDSAQSSSTSLASSEASLKSLKQHFLPLSPDNSDNGVGNLNTVFSESAPAAVSKPTLFTYM